MSKVNKERQWFWSSFNYSHLEAGKKRDLNSDDDEGVKVEEHDDDEEMVMETS